MAKGTTMNDHDLLLRLDENVSNILKFLEGIPNLEVRIRAVEMDMATVSTSCKTDIGTLTKEVDTLRSKSNTWDVILGIATLIGTGIGAIFGNRS